MNEQELRSFYERLYFHELESKEHLVARLQLVLAMVTVLLTLVGYIALRVDVRLEKGIGSAVSFSIFALIGVALLAAALVHFIRALWGHQYECLPVAHELHGYKLELIGKYAPRADCTEVSARFHDEALRNYFIKCATTNATINAFRSERLHDSLSYLIYSLPFIFVSVLIFLVAGLSHPGAP